MRWIVLASLAVAVAGTAAHPQTLDCRDWNSPSFFAFATVADVEHCLAAGYIAETRNSAGWTPLHFAAGLSDTPEMLTILVNGGADPNAQHEYGWTPLHVAAKYSNNPEILAILIDGGANPNVRDGDGRTAWDLAQNNDALEGLRAYLFHRTLAGNARAAATHGPEIEDVHADEAYAEALKQLAHQKLEDCREMGAEVLVEDEPRPNVTADFNEDGVPDPIISDWIFQCVNDEGPFGYFNGGSGGTIWTVMISRPDGGYEPTEFFAKVLNVVHLGDQLVLLASVSGFGCGEQANAAYCVIAHVWNGERFVP